MKFLSWLTAPARIDRGRTGLEIRLLDCNVRESPCEAQDLLLEAATAIAAQRAEIEALHICNMIVVTR